MEKMYLDENGYQEYLKEIDKIREKLKQNSSDISEFMSDDAYGDGWHDNFAYEQAMVKENMLRRELENKLKGLDNIVIIKNKNNSNKSKVELGMIVDIEFADNSIETYLITGALSSDIFEKIPAITINSPLGKAIYKKEKNTLFTYQVDNNTISGKIIDIRSKENE